MEIESKVDLLKTEIWIELNDQLTALEKIHVINHFLFKIHKYSRSARGVQSPQLFFINHVLDTHKGLPISLAIIYAEIAALLELPIYCVDLPFNFLLCYRDPTFLDDPDGILFYINPYTQGTVIGRAEVEFFLRQQKMDIKPEFLRPGTNIETIIRLAEGLRFAYAASRMDEKVNFLDELLEILKKGPPDYNL
jgi:regulator of sirC expression with transglutaminase-like and TPR domain